MKVGFIGLGQMGSGMAASLLKAGHDVTVYNRSAHKSEPLVVMGAKAATRVADACRGDVVFTMLADDGAVESVTLGNDGILEYLDTEAIHVSCSTISVALCESLTQFHTRAGQGFIAAPVFGRPEVAAAGKLFVVGAGRQAALERVLPLLEAIGQRVFKLSERPRDANLVKLSGNFLIAAVIESLGEALALVEKGGVDRAQYVDILTSTLFGAPIYKVYGGLLVERKFTPAGFAAPLGQKDIRLTLAAAENLRVPMPIASLLRDRFLTLLARGGDHLDWSAIGDLASIDAGTAEPQPRS
jgi:3-hydroxyisobutyrate dehydrogenase-like beta-hydroxyacid dehydrogenase